MARKSYTRKVISQKRDDYFSKLLADIKRYAQRIINLKKKGLLEKASTKINCLVCNEILAEPTGGKSNVHARVLELLE